MYVAYICGVSMGVRINLTKLFTQISCIFRSFIKKKRKKLTNCYEMLELLLLFYC